MSDDLISGVSYSHMIRVVDKVTFSGKAPPAPEKAAPKKKKAAAETKDEAKNATEGEQETLL